MSEREGPRDGDWLPWFSAVGGGVAVFGVIGAVTSHDPGPVPLLVAVFGAVVFVVGVLWRARQRRS